jgi:N-acetylglucosaminyl-diphospho-decaprenol L-rhamnosyltransferase
MSHPLGVIIVTHNSQRVIGACVAALERQRVSLQVIMIDSGSDDTGYLEPFRNRPGFTVECRDNIGFSAASNAGLSLVDRRANYVLFINPDTFVGENSLASALEIIVSRPRIGALTGILKGYDIADHRPNGLIDSTGVFRTWYGRWYDRGQGQPVGSGYGVEQEVPALCGAFMMCRVQALQSVLEKPDSQLFDESYFMYKEDIDLSIRLRKRGWSLLYTPRVIVYHGRGWAKDRQQIDHQVRCLASANEVKLNLKHRSPYLLWSIGKYLAVRILHL